MTYLDTSALVPLYLFEPSTAAVVAAAIARPVLAVSDLTRPELASAAAIKIRTGAATLAEARAALEEFDRHLRAGLYRRLTIRARHYRDAADRIARFDVPLRTLDALHLSTAALAGAELLTLDAAPARAAEASGVAVVVPEG